MARTIYTAPPDSGVAHLGHTLPQLLDEGCARHPNPRALNQFTEKGWQPFSSSEFNEQAEDVALGWLDLGFERGDHVAMFMHSDVYFVMVDMGCLICGLVDAPLYLTNVPETTQYIINHAEARALVVSDLELLAEIRPLLSEIPLVKTLVVAQATAEELEACEATLPRSMHLLSLEDLRARGRSRRQASPNEVAELKAALRPDDVATLIYTSGTTGQPKGVMLTHENISYNALTAYSGIPMGRGPEETVISFLPLTHVFARSLNYGALQYGFSVFFTRPDMVAEHFQEVRPTIFATVPRVLEKVYGKIMLKGMELDGLKRKLFDWSMQVARKFEVGRTPKGVFAAKLALADKLVLSKWRAALGGRIKFLISGGAALSKELTNLFAAAGVPIYQGYGLTETSPVITYNRPGGNRAGTVGVPMPGLEVSIAEDGEILTRGPHVMKGYFKNESATEEVINDEGWFHTGDIGVVSEDGYLKITDRKKALFKLSTGKYVVPQPIENFLMNQPLVEQAVVVGSGYKYCMALLFINEDVLRAELRSRGAEYAEASIDTLVHEPGVYALYQNLVDQANDGRSHWETVKRFALLATPLTVESGYLTPSLKVKRSKVNQAFSEVIDELYAESAVLGV